MFKETYFYIESGYIWGKGHSENESNIFNAEIKRIFENVLTGWTLKEKTINNACNEYLYKDGLSSLYCHPMTISGIIDTNLIEIIKKELENSRIIELRSYKTFSEYENISNEEVQNRISLRKNEMIKDIFDTFQTKTRKHYFYIGNLDRLRDKYHIGTVLDKNNAIERIVLENTLNYMIDINLIVKESDSRGINLYRALNKTEFKTWSKKNKQLLQEIGA